MALSGQTPRLRLSCRNSNGALKETSDHPQAGWRSHPSPSQPLATARRPPKRVVGRRPTFTEPQASQATLPCPAMPRPGYPCRRQPVTLQQIHTRIPIIEDAKQPSISGKP